MTHDQVAEKVLEDVFKRAARPKDLIPLAVFSAATAYVALQVLPDDIRAQVNREVAKIRTIMDAKIAEREASRNLVTPDKN